MANRLRRRLGIVICCECGHWSITAKNNKGVCWGCRYVYGPV